MSISLILRRPDAEQQVHLISCNPDIIYPVSTNQYGFTSGGLATMLEAVLAQRYSDQDIKFERLGKPASLIFEEARRRGGTNGMAMIGDQLTTDILGANRFGIDSVLVETGLALNQLKNSTLIRPTWRQKNLAI